mgnify:CR=1 FL=1
MKLLVLIPLLLISLTTLAAPQELSMSFWKSLSEEDQQNILISATYTEDMEGYTNYKVVDYKDHTMVHNRQHVSYIKEVYEVISNNMSFDDIDQRLGSDTGYGVITSPIIRLTALITEDTDEILGTYAYIRIQGAYKEEITADDESFYFADKSEAMENGFDPELDISWAGRLYFKASASLFADEFLAFEWSGW